MRTSLAVVTISISIAASVAAAGCSGGSAAPHVIDIAGEIGLPTRSRTYGATVFDQDRDGWPDLLIGRHEGPALLFRNDRGRYVSSEAVPFAERLGAVDRHDCAAGRLNDDTLPDLYCAVGGERGRTRKHTPNELWLQEVGGAFTNHGDRPDLADPYGRGRQVLVFDADHDGDDDIFVGNASPRFDDHRSPNRLFLNEPGTAWRSAPELGLDEELSVSGPNGSRPRGCMAELDANGDGWRDVLVCGQEPGSDGMRTHVYLNGRGAGFRDATDELGLSGSASDAAIIDFDDDGTDDVVTVGDRGLEVHVRRGTQFRTVLHIRLERSVRVAAADANGDRRPDFYVMRGGKPWTGIADVMVLSRGDRSNDYEIVDVPRTRGNGTQEDDVVAIDHDRNGVAEFLALNGLSEHLGERPPVNVFAVDPD